MTDIVERMRLRKERWMDGTELDVPDADCTAAADEIERLRTAHHEIIRKYEKIMGDPPDWTTFNGNDERLKYAREAWFGAAQISRNAL